MLQLGLLTDQYFTEATSKTIISQASYCRECKISKLQMMSCYSCNQPNPTIAFPPPKSNIVFLIHSWICSALPLIHFDQVCLPSQGKGAVFLELKAAPIADCDAGMSMGLTLAVLLLLLLRLGLQSYIHLQGSKSHWTHF